MTNSTRLFLGAVSVAAMAVTAAPAFVERPLSWLTTAPPAARWPA